MGGISIIMVRELDTRRLVTRTVTVTFTVSWTLFMMRLMFSTVRNRWGLRSGVFFISGPGIEKGVGRVDGRYVAFGVLC